MRILDLVNGDHDKMNSCLWFFWKCVFGNSECSQFKGMHSVQLGIDKTLEWSLAGQNFLVYCSFCSPIREGFGKRLHSDTLFHRNHLCDKGKLLRFHLVYTKSTEGKKGFRSSLSLDGPLVEFSLLFHWPCALYN
jgi:hypothetical protein